MSSVEAFSGAVALSSYDAFAATDQAALDALPVAICLCSADGTIVRFNRRAVALWGRTPRPGDAHDTYAGSARLYSLDGDELPHASNPMETALRTGDPQHDKELVIERPDGSRIVVLVGIDVLKDDSGATQGAISSFQDITDRKQATQREIGHRREVEQAAHRLASIVESSEDAIVSKDLDGTIITWNKGAERLFGYTAGEVIGKSVTILIPADHRNEEPGILKRIRAGERVEHYETKRQHKNGSLIDISLTVSPVRNGDGVIVGASKIARDITDRKRAEQALVRHMTEQGALYGFTERLHRATSIADVYDAAIGAIVQALGCSRASVLMFDETDKMRFVAWRGLSDGYRQAVDGHSPWAAEAKDPAAIFVDDVARADMPDTLKAVIEAEGIGAVAFIPLVAGGRLVGKFMAYYETPHRFDEAEADLALTIARQLGFSVARIQVEEALRESERRLQMALNAGRMGAWEWDIASGKVIWSPGLEELHGIQQGTFGGTLEDFKRDIHPDDVAEAEARIRQALETRGDYHLVYRIRRPDGALRWLESFGAFGADAKGAPRLAGVCVDISERKQAEAQRDLVVAELSHRVKNTLATVISIARHSFATNPNAGEAQRSFNARIQALGQTHSRLAEANWSGVLLETVLLDELAPYRHQDGANVRVSGPVTVLNAKQALTLGMAMHELVTNAAKYGALSTEHGVVDVRWEVDTEPNQLRIIWAEQGGPTVRQPQRNGFGRLLIERVLASDLKGDVRMDFAEDGLTCVITVPLSIHLPATEVMNFLLPAQ